MLKPWHPSNQAGLSCGWRCLERSFVQANRGRVTRECTIPTVRILFISHGTRGDVQPLLALAVALRASGHDVRFLVPANFVEWVCSHGFPCDSDGIDVHAVLTSPDVNPQSFRYQLRYVRAVADRLFEAAVRASAGTELIVGAALQLQAASAADLRGVPHVSAVFCPCAVPSDTAPPIPWQTMPAWMNRTCWRLGLPAGDVLLRGAVSAHRATHGLGPVRRPLTSLAEGRTLLAADRDLGPLGHGAPPAVVQTDAWILAGRDELDPRIDAFLRAGPPPIYIGFGSMVATDTARLASSIAAAAPAAGRLIISGGWAALHQKVPAAGGMSAEVSANVLTIDEAPHDALFPRVAAVVHHGGAGTTGAAARAGVPQVILPHLLDQYYWAHRIERLGLGPPAPRVEHVTAEALARCLRLVVDDARFGARARAFGARVAPRNGVGAAVEYLEAVGRTRRSRDTS